MYLSYYYVMKNAIKRSKITLPAKERKILLFPPIDKKEYGRITLFIIKKHFDKYNKIDLISHPH